MRKFLVLFLFVMISSAAMAAEKINLRGQKCEFPDIKNWAVCEVDTDCVVAFNMCGLLNSVNAKFAAEQEEYNDCVGPMISCAGPDENQNKENAIAACVNKTCVIKIKK